MSFLLDTDATLTLIKVENLKGDTLMRKNRLALTRVTGHKIHTLGISATIKREIRHIMYVIRDDFFINYEGILGFNFLNKQRAKCDHSKKQVHIGNITFKLYPLYKNTVLIPCSEIIIQAVTDRNIIGVVKVVETKPGVFIGNCLIAPEGNVCPISAINITEESVKITMFLVTMEKDKKRRTYVYLGNVK
ncbi:hypothetical protein P5V15_001079 [Pogonomyrmex californicus]